MNSDARILRVQQQYRCSRADALIYLSLRDEGHSTAAAALMAGISDPDY